MALLSGLLYYGLAKLVPSDLLSRVNRQSKTPGPLHRSFLQKNRLGSLGFPSFLESL